MNQRILSMLLLLLVVCIALGPAQTGLKITEIQYDVPPVPTAIPTVTARGSRPATSLWNCITARTQTLI